ncbi:Tubulin beta [Fusarium oxysporum f. sp. albedinis]|nr:Tubulin beta [Fusarium oxysporum f. sp. albedinis]
MVGYGRTQGNSKAERKRAIKELKYVSEEQIIAIAYTNVKQTWFPSLITRKLAVGHPKGEKDITFQWAVPTSPENENLRQNRYIFVHTNIVSWIDSARNNHNLILLSANPSASLAFTSLSRIRNSLC